MAQTLLTVRDVAAKWSVSPRTVERYIERGDLQALRFGPKLIRIKPEAVEAFEESLCPTTDSSGPSSTSTEPSSGTSPGRKIDARVVKLRG